MALTSTRLTAEEYFALPPTEKRTQLIDGEIVVTEPTVRHQRLAEGDRPGRDAKRIVGPPALAVEVRSPSTWRYDLGAKKSTYERLGLAELWLVDTESDSVLVYRRSSAESREFDVALELGAGESLTTPLIPGFALDLAALFDR